MRYRNAAIVFVLLGLFFLIGCQHAGRTETRKTVNLRSLMFRVDAEVRHKIG